jgi:hypothetical protein
MDNKSQDIAIEQLKEVLRNIEPRLARIGSHLQLKSNEEKSGAGSI